MDGRAVTVIGVLLGALNAPAQATAAPAATTREPANDGITFLRTDFGLNAPSGFLALTVGRVFGPRVSAEVSGGIGAGASFLVAGGRVYVANIGPNWRFGAGFGGSLGFTNASCCLEDETPPDSPSYWLHQELSLSRLKSHGLTLHFAIGIEELMIGKYHVDVTDVNFVDREAIDVLPYARVGIGWGF